MTPTHEGTSQKVILVGNPNVGKSVIFGELTGRYVNVSNYPGTTVEVTRGEAKERGCSIEIIDTPGVYSLLPMSEDEKVTRDILMEEQDAAVIQVGDAKNLRRSLLITVQLAEMELPLILAINMVDEARDRGVMPCIDTLEEELGVPIVQTVAVRRKGTDRLLGTLTKARPSKVRIAYGEAIETALSEMERLFSERTPIGKRAIALMLLCGDESLSPWLSANARDAAVIREMNDVRFRLVDRVGEDIAFHVNQARLRWIDSMLGRLGFEDADRKEGGIADRFGRWSMDPFYGVPILFVVLFLAYEFVGVFGAGVLGDLIQDRLFARLVLPAVTGLVDRIFPWPILRDFLVGPYGLVSMALSYAVAIVLPIVGTFFIGFGILEDSGYLPRLSVMVDRIFKRIGCNGKAILPLVLGLGCATMATLTARILDTRKERLIVTLLLALGIPCSAQLGVIMGMLGSLGGHAMIGWLLIVASVILVVGFLASRVFPGESSDFILEIPPIRVPKVGNLVVKTMARIEWYLREAVPLFVLGTVFLFAADRAGALDWIENASRPVFVRLLDLPPETASAFIIGFLRRDYGAAGLYRMSKEGMLDHTQIFVSLVTMTLFVPCMANFLVVIKEHGPKVAFGMALFIFPFALLVGGGVNMTIRHFGLSF